MTISPGRVVRVGALLALLCLLGTPARDARAGLSISLWYPMGPDPACCFYPDVVSGRATAVAVNPNNSQDVWLGTAGGGVWHSADGGEHWKAMSDHQPSGAIGALALDDCGATYCTTVYAGTGENAIRRDTYYGAGLLVGTFDGTSVTWLQQTGAPFDLTHGSIWNIVLGPKPPSGPRAITVTFSSGVTSSASEATVTAPEPFKGSSFAGYGIYSSDTSFTTWHKLSIPGTFTASGNQKPTDLEMDPSDSNTLYAGFMDTGLFKSIDGGTTWCPLNPGIPRSPACATLYPIKAGQNLPNPYAPHLPDQEIFDNVEIAIAPSNHLHVYAAFGRCPNKFLYDCTPDIYDSLDGGLTWTHEYTGSSTPTTQNAADITCPHQYSRYSHGLTVDPGSENMIYLGGFHICRSSFQGAIWDSPPLDTWVKNKGTGTDRKFIHPDHRKTSFDPTVPGLMYDANDGGLAMSPDFGAHWTPKAQGIGSLEFQAIATSVRSQSVIGGLQDNSCFIWKGGKQWSQLSGSCGDAGFGIMPSVDSPAFTLNWWITSNDYYCRSGVPTYLCSNADFAVLPERSTDNGITWLDPHYSPHVYDTALQTGEPRSFYPPLLQLPNSSYDLFGASRLYYNPDDGPDWFPLSPTLSPATNTEILGGTDVITAIAVAPTNGSHMYVGYYSGKIFSSTGPCLDASCWPGSFYGPGPITMMAVDPTDENTVYATVGGFASTPHVYKATMVNGVQVWNSIASAPALNGAPVNSVALEDANTVYVGTDHTIYKSTNAGSTWYPFDFGLPDVPVYMIAFDPVHSRLLAATHGRGTYILSHPTIRYYADRTSPGIRKAMMFSGEFQPNQSCMLQVLRRDGSVCASGRTDALGGTVRTDGQGFLVTSRTGYYTDSPLVWVCAQGNCLGSPVANCNIAGDPMGSLEVACGSQVATSAIDGPTIVANPPTASLTLNGLPRGTLPPGSLVDPGTESAEDTVTPAGPSAGPGTFFVMPVLQAGDGSTRTLCNVPVPFTSTDTVTSILLNASTMLTSDPTCVAKGVGAEFMPPKTGEAEDPSDGPPTLVLHAPSLSGGALVPATRGPAGQATDLCFVLGGLDDAMTNTIRGMSVHFETPPGGAAGGTLSITERSSMGQCSIDVPTAAGNTPAVIAGAVAAAFQASGIPSPYPGCPVEANPRDLVAKGNLVTATMPSELVVCSHDSGVGVAIAPEEICLTDADCDDGNPCTADTCNPSTGLCQSTPLPDGTSCDDHNACTVGSACVSGSCGTPVVCNDGNPCSTDVCDPATGACTSASVVCDDGNPCTTDSCNPATGQCRFVAESDGTACNDGDLCTSGDVCVLLPGQVVPTCQGQPKCADADPCTADRCDPTTGACSNPPIQCDDGNPCTLDLCMGGSCVSSPMAGACDDGNRCTIGDTCTPGPAGQPVCSGMPTNCDDGDACTMDTCNPVTGGCLHMPIGSAEVPAGFQFTSSSSMTWPGVSGAAFYNTYRGTIPQHMMGSRPPAGPLYDQTCFEYDDAFGDGATNSTDASAPPVGTGFYYLVSEETGCGESGIGSDWNNTPIPNSNPCSNPASPALQIVKSHSGSFTQGQNGASYTIVVSNIGPGPSFGTVTVTDLAPSGLTLVSMAGPGWSCPASPGDTCTRSDTLGPGLAYPPITVTANVSGTATSPQVNKGEVSGGGAPVATSNDSTTIIPLAPALSVTKTHSGNFYRGETGATYAVTVSNTGNAPTTGTVTVSDTVPGGFTNVALSGTGWTCPTPGATCTRSDALAPGGSYPVITVTLDVAPAAPVPTLTNQVTVSGGGSASASASDPTQIDYPLLAMLKHHTGNFVQGQQGAVYALSVQNQGFGPTAGTTVTVTENAPSGLTLVSMAGTGWSCPASPGNVCTRSDVLASTAFWPDITVTVNVATNAPSSVTNVATISGGGSNGTGSANDPTNIDTARIVLGITKTHSGNFVQGQPFATYTVTVRNGGNAPASGTVTVTENAPAGLTLQSMAGTGWTCPSPGNTCTRSDALAPSASYPDITVTVSVAPNAPSSVTNQATVTGGGDGTLHTASDPTTINPGPPVLAVTKTHNGNFSQGQTNARYFVTISNVASQATAGPVMMMEQPPPGLTVVSMSGTGWTCNTVQCSRPDPLPGGAFYPVITITVSVAAGTTSPQVNHVQVNGGGSPPAMATDSTTIIPAGVPSLSITKTHAGNFFQGQTNATYTVVVSNNVGAGTTVGPVNVNDAFPSGLVPVSMAGTGWTCTPTSCNRNTALAPGASYPAITVTVNVLATATSPQVNQVNAGGGGSAPASYSDSTVIGP
jgi:uncharacterized repeat protein (TIGR01451 family)